MTTAFAIVDRDTGEFYDGKFKLYKTEAIAKRVLTQHGTWAPRYAYAVVEMDLVIKGVIDPHKLTEKEFNDMMDDERDRLDSFTSAPNSYRADWETRAEKRAKRFWKRFHDIKYI